MLTKQEFLEPLARRRTNEVVVTSMSAVRPWGQLSNHPLDFASADSAMGHAADLALGIALARPDRRVICLNGDGSMLMSLGTLVTIAQCRATNLVLVIAQNDTYEITGNQSIPGAGRIDFAGMARAAGWPHAFTFDAAGDYEEQLSWILHLDGPVAVVIHVAPGDEGPLTRGDGEIIPYLRPSLDESAHRLRDSLALTLS